MLLAQRQSRHHRFPGRAGRARSATIWSRCSRTATSIGRASVSSAGCASSARALMARGGDGGRDAAAVPALVRPDRPAAAHQGARHLRAALVPRRQEWLSDGPAAHAAATCDDAARRYPELAAFSRWLERRVLPRSSRQTHARWRRRRRERAACHAAGRRPRRAHAAADRRDTQAAAAGARQAADRASSRTARAGSACARWSSICPGSASRSARRSATAARWGLSIRYSDEGAQALETGGGIFRALPWLGTRSIPGRQCGRVHRLRFCHARNRARRVGAAAAGPQPAATPSGDFGFDGSLSRKRPGRAGPTPALASTAPSCSTAVSPGAFHSAVAAAGDRGRGSARTDIPGRMERRRDGGTPAIPAIAGGDRCRRVAGATGAIPLESTGVAAAYEQYQTHHRPPCGRASAEPRQSRAQRGEIPDAAGFYRHQGRHQAACRCDPCDCARRSGRRQAALAARADGSGRRLRLRPPYGARAPPGDGLRGSQVPEHRRMLECRHRHSDADGCGVHARLPLLCG